MSNYFDFSSYATDSLKNLRQISPGVQSHLKQVYFDLACALATSAVGVYLHLLWNIGGTLTTIACALTMLWLGLTPAYNQSKKFGLLMAAALLEGASVGPLIDVAIQIDSSIIIAAFVGTAIAFACFTGAAMLSRRREFLYLYGIISSGLSILLWLHFASYIFGGSATLFMFEIYFGLLVFVGYIVYDTQLIIERAHLGEMDHVMHALLLFVDFAAVFVRVLLIMLKNSEKRESRRKKRD